MTTLATMKAQIANDIERSDLTSEIATAISKAIGQYQTTRFFFNEARVEFSTVAGQSSYTSSDDADIGTLMEIDDAYVIVGGIVSRLHVITPDRWEYLNDNSASTGEPYCYTWFAGAIRIYPVPSAIYTVRLHAHVSKAEPASDGETGNVWMTYAYEVIRAAARKFLSAETTMDGEMTQSSEALEMDALTRLMARSSKITGTGIIRPTCW